MSEIRTCQFYALALNGNPTQLLAYDEYCADSGTYHTPNVYMCERFSYLEATERIDHEKSKGRRYTTFSIEITARNDDIIECKTFGA